MKHIKIAHGAKTPLDALRALFRRYGDEVHQDRRGNMIVCHGVPSDNVIDFDPRLVEFGRAMKGDGPEVA